MTKKIFLLLLLMSSLAFRAQEAAPASGPQMADALRDNGKIFVVITVISIVFLFIVAFLIFLERKIKKLEQKIGKN